MKMFPLYFALVTALSIYSASVWAGVAIIVHPSNPLGNITAQEASKIFLAKTKTFANGKKIVIYDQEEGTEIRDQFYSSVTNKSASQVKAYWSRLIFTGKGQPPKVVFDDDEVVEAVGAEENAVGYVDSEAVTGDVKVVLEIGN
ncbi:MAG: phosphate ABC transporter substrate-binding protein [Moraxellaceae bacterium]|nr:MAG: phosphate ABC transporter substrate-binding protein [Moraxellaceae bacterium]